MTKQQVKIYLDYLGLSYPLKDLNDISLLVKNHLKTYPFTSIPVVLKENISLEVSDIFRKIILNKRGGYCFEHNKIIYKVLKYFGFNVEHHFARVVNNQDIITPLTHRFTLLNYEDEKYIIDVGVGFISPASLVKFTNDPTPSHLGISYKVITNADASYSLEMIQNDQEYTMYKFDLHKCYEIDFKLGNFYSHKHPNAVFVNNLVLSLIEDTCIKSLRNNIYVKIYKYKEEIQNINSIEEFKDILKNEFSYPIYLDEIKYLYENFVKTTK